MKIPKAKFLLLFIILWEIAVYFISRALSEDVTVYYQIAARYSARTSFVIIGGLMLWTGIKGLPWFYAEETRRQSFRNLILLFAVNHVIHFVYLAMHFYHNELELIAPRTILGMTAYLSLVLAPYLLWNKTSLSQIQMILVYAFLLWIIGIFLVTYIKRPTQDIPMATPELLYHSMAGIVVILMGMNVYQVFRLRGYSTAKTHSISP